MANIKQIIRDRENFKNVYEYLDKKYLFVYDFDLGSLRYKKNEGEEWRSADYLGINDLYIELVLIGLELKKSSIEKLIYLLAKPKENSSDATRR